ncbi:MAG: hypothetical protein M1839_002105 [Geoglossum umbratile]|nr:MAG: hypothetical protein M1839_002105 [Geoglossum umbratile]
MDFVRQKPIILIRYIYWVGPGKADYGRPLTILLWYLVTGMLITIVATINNYPPPNSPPSDIFPGILARHYCRCSPSFQLYDPHGRHARYYRYPRLSSSLNRLMEGGLDVSNGDTISSDYHDDSGRDPALLQPPRQGESFFPSEDIRLEPSDPTKDMKLKLNLLAQRLSSLSRSPSQPGTNTQPKNTKKPNPAPQRQPTFQPSPPPASALPPSRQPLIQPVFYHPTTALPSPHAAPIRNFVNRKALPALPEFHCVPTPNFTLDRMYAPNHDHATTQITQMTNSPATGTGNLATILPAAPLMDDTPSIAVLTPLTCAAIDSPSPLQSFRTVNPAIAGGVQPPYASLVPPSMLDAGHSSAPYYPMPAQGYFKTAHTPDYHDALVGAIERTAREVVKKMRFAVFNSVWAEVGVTAIVFGEAAE